MSEERESPKALWPYFEEPIDPEAVLAAQKATDDAIEPKPGGGYRWKPGREPKE